MQIPKIKVDSKIIFVGTTTTTTTTPSPVTTTTTTAYRAIRSFITLKRSEVFK